MTSMASGTSDPASEEVRKVWASVWNWRAFEERAFWNIDHRAVRMGVAVHQAFPDEQVNGVMITRNIADPIAVQSGVRWFVARRSETCDRERRRVCRR